MFDFIRYAIFQLLNLAQILILIRSVISFFPIRHNKYVDVLYAVTEPILAPVRNLLEKTMGERASMIDFSPIVVFLIIGFIQRLL